MATLDLAQQSLDFLSISFYMPTGVKRFDEPAGSISLCITNMQNRPARAQVFIHFSRNLHRIFVGKVHQYVTAALKLQCRPMLDKPKDSHFFGVSCRCPQHVFRCTGGRDTQANAFDTNNSVEQCVRTSEIVEPPRIQQFQQIMLEDSSRHRLVINICVKSLRQNHAARRIEPVTVGKQSGERLAGHADQCCILADRSFQSPGTTPPAQGRVRRKDRITKIGRPEKALPTCLYPEW
ncbi:hypothetical protein ASD68_15480 [Rhodanobacter sp. Root627]|nr:hypothetical protein ASD68_15480 [Rhodanobacter sp. Root627]